MSSLSGKIIKLERRNEYSLVVIKTGNKEQQQILALVKDKSAKIGDDINILNGYMKKNVFIAENFSIVRKNIQTRKEDIHCFVCNTILDLTSYKTILLNSMGIEKFQDPKDATCKGSYKSMDDIVETCWVCAEMFGTRGKDGKLLPESVFTASTIEEGIAIGNVAILNEYRAKNRAVLWLTHKDMVGEQHRKEKEFEFKEE